ncbi:MAG: HAMP domain-containing protein [FCB group bacterium]|nr:HAMP domain-containing protein [FCB group bacterium]
MKFRSFKNMTWRSRMIIVALTILFIFGSVATVMINQVREKHFHQYMVELVRPMETLIHNNIIHNMENHQPNHFQSILEGLSTNDKIRWVRVLDRDFRVVFADDSSMVGEVASIPTLYQPKLARANLVAYTIEDSVPILRIVSKILNEPSCQPCHGSTAPVNGYIEIGMNDSPEVKVETMMLRYDFISFFLFITVLSVILGIVHNRTFQKPLTELKASIQQIESGDFSTRVKLDTPGELRGLAETISRMTEQLEKSKHEVDKLHQNQIERAGQLASVGELAASVAHEIKNPIAGIRNALEILLDRDYRLRKDPIYKEMLFQINRVTKTINDLMDYAKPREPHFQEVELHSILEQVIALQRPKIASEQIQLTVALASSHSVVNGDIDLLKQIFANLILNAYQATEKGKGDRISITTEYLPGKKRIRISVKNTGSWIPKDLMDLIFKPFYTTKHKGTGLGLSLTKSFVEKHGGTITVNSSPEHWTEFLVELPVQTKGGVS